MKHRRFLAALAALVLAGCVSGCPYRPGPTPDATGGTGAVGPVPTGGSSGAGQGGVGGWEPFDTGGRPSRFEQCVTEQLDDPVNQNVSLRSGVPLTALVYEMCADPAMQSGYR